MLDLGAGFGRWSNFLAAHLRCRVVGLDYSMGGCQLGRGLSPESSQSRFLAGEITALPFPAETFDGFIAVLILDNVPSPEGRRAVEEICRVVAPGSPGFVVLNPWPMPAAADSAANPTAGCARHDYSDEEAARLLDAWSIRGTHRDEHGLRAYTVRS